MRGIIYIVLLLFLILGNPVNAQSSRACECADRITIDNLNSYEDLFNPDQIAFCGFKTAKIYYSNNLEKEDSLYATKEFSFNSSGYVVQRIWYSESGAIHYMYLFDRNKENKVTKESEFFNPRLRHKDTLWNDFNILYLYDEHGRLVKQKTSKYGGEILPDSMSDIVFSKYNESGRLETKRYQYYFEDDENPVKQSIYTYEYKEDGSSILSPLEKSNYYSIEKRTYNNDLKPILTEIITHTMDSVFTQLTIECTYTEESRLESYIQKAYITVPEECPEKNTFTEHYVYNEFGLIEEIIHMYDSVTCKMLIKYE
jgi:flagellar hook protein FlgE